MKVLVIFTYGYSLLTWKNTGTLEKELAIYNQLSNKYNLNFTFMTYGDENDISLLKDYKKFEVLPVYKFINKSNYKTINYLKSFLIPFRFRKKVKEFHLIKQHQLLGSWVAIIFKLLTRKKVFIRTGYDMYLFSIQENKKWYIKYLYKLLTKFSITFCDKYSVTSKSDFEYLKKNYLKSISKLNLRPNWVEKVFLDEFEKRKKDKILFVGRLESQKNLTFIINELQNTNFELDIVGEGSEYNFLKKLGSDLNVTINFLGSLPNSELINFYKNYQFFINASKFEGNPKTVLEAMSMGCIVLLSKIPNHLELVTHGVEGFIFELNVGALKEILDNLYKVDYKKIVLNSTNKVKKFNNFNQAVENEYLDYLELVNYVK